MCARVVHSVANVVFEVSIWKTCPCNEYPLKPHFYISKIGVCRAIPIFFFFFFFFFFLLKKANDCGYSLEPPWQGGSNVYSQSVF